MSDVSAQEHGARMSRLAKAYIVVTTLALLGFIVFFAFTLIVGRAQNKETPEVVGNIGVAARIVTGSQLDELLQTPSRAQSERVRASGLFLVTRVWPKAGLGGYIVSARAEIVSPSFLKGRFVSIGGAGYNIEQLQFIDHLNEDQRQLALTSVPVLRVASAWIK